MPEYKCEDENVTGKKRRRGNVGRKKGGREMLEKKREVGMWEARVGGEEREGPRIHLLLVGPAPEMFGLIETIFFQWL